MQLSYVQDIQTFCKYTLYRISDKLKLEHVLKFYKILLYILQYFDMYWAFKHVAYLYIVHGTKSGRPAF